MKKIKAATKDEVLVKKEELVDATKEGNGNRREESCLNV